MRTTKLKSYYIVATITIFYSLIVTCKKDEIPVVVLKTYEATNITGNSATIEGEILSTGGATITKRGICISEKQNPTPVDGHILGVGTNSRFSVEVSELKHVTRFYYRAFAISSSGVFFGEEFSFSTNPIPPTVESTTLVTEIRATTATSGGNITHDGGSLVTARGVVWSRMENPTTSNREGITINSGGMGIYSSHLTDLTYNTAYYVRAYAVNLAGTSYGPQQVFTTTDGLSSVQTDVTSDVTGTSVVSGGNISSDGGFPVIARGIVWSTSQNPTIASNLGFSNNGAGAGHFICNITGLTINTTYYYRAYSTNIVGTSYGEQLSFTTTNGLPILSTNDVTNITYTTASCGGIITSDGGSSLFACGVVWSTSQNPSISDNEGISINGNQTGSYSEIITNLSSNTTYYVRAYATNTFGTSYGNQVSLLTQWETSSGTFTDPKDGNVYRTIAIGSQIWMAENLRYLPSVVGSNTNSYTEPVYYVPGYQGTNVDQAKATENYSTYGVLYNWHAALASCPVGWHLPTDDEWNELTTFLGGLDIAGGKLKATGTVEAGTGLWRSPNSGATNETGFSALPGASTYNSYSYLGYYGYWWTATDYNSSGSAWRRFMGYLGSSVSRVTDSKHVGFSVRCVWDN